MTYLFLNLDTATINMYLLIFIILAIFFRPLIKKVMSNFAKIRKLKKSGEAINVIEIEQALEFLSKHKIGALIAFQRKDSLQEYVEKGVKISAVINKELLISIFNKTSPIHDGAIIIANGLIEACATFFPSVNKKMDPQFGARHRAAIGLTLKNDAFVIVVSETSGNISFVTNGEFNKIEKEEGAIHKELLKLTQNE